MSQNIQWFPVFEQTWITWSSEEISEEEYHSWDPPLNLWSSWTRAMHFQIQNRHSTIINFNKKFQFWILRIKYKMTVQIQKVHRLKNSVVKFMNQTASNSEVESTLTQTKQFTNWSNNEPNKTIQLWNQYENQIMKEPKISVAWEENIYLTVVPATQQPSSNTAAVWQKPFSPASRGLLLLIAGQPTCLHHALGFQLARVSTPTQNSQVPSLAVTQICCDWVKLALYLHNSQATSATEY